MAVRALDTIATGEHNTPSRAQIDRKIMDTLSAIQTSAGLEQYLTDLFDKKDSEKRVQLYRDIRENITNHYSLSGKVKTGWFSQAGRRVTVLKILDRLQKQQNKTPRITVYASKKGGALDPRNEGHHSFRPSWTDRLRDSVKTVYQKVEEATEQLAYATKESFYSTTAGTWKTAASVATAAGLAAIAAGSQVPERQEDLEDTVRTESDHETKMQVTQLAARYRTAQQIALEEVYTQRPELRPEEPATILSNQELLAQRARALGISTTPRQTYQGRNFNDALEDMIESGQEELLSLQQIQELESDPTEVIVNYSAILEDALANYN